MMAFNDNITDYFFQEIKKNGEYTINQNGKSIIITPREEDQYYKPVIYVKNIENLKIELLNYLQTLLDFYRNKNCFAEYQDLSYFLNNTLMGITNSDATNFEAYINKKIQFFNYDPFKALDQEKNVYQTENIKIFAKREQEYPGFESPYIMTFRLELNKIIYYLPLIRYAIDKNGVCNLFVVQMGRKRMNQNPTAEYKSIVNSVNKGIKKFRNVQPSFVISLRLFLDLLQDEQISKIVVPDFLCSKYRNYYKSKNVAKSDKILERILNNFIILLQRMEYQFPDFEIINYPNEIDSYTHINLTISKRKKLVNLYDEK